MGPSLQAEIAIMVGILVGAWVLKVIAVAIYMICSKRRMERLQQRQAELTFGSCKPTPEHVIGSLPVMTYAKLQNQPDHCAASALAASATAQQTPPQHQQQFASALQAAVFAGCLSSSNITAPHSPYPPQPQSAQNSTSAGTPALMRFSLCTPAQQGIDKGLSTSHSAASLHTTIGPCDDLTRQQSSDRDCCPICFNDYEACSQVKQLPCKHYYHSECIDQWLVRDNTCPLCKSPVWSPPTNSKEPTTAEAAPEADAANSTQAPQNEATLALMPGAAPGLHRAVEPQPLEQQQPQLQQVVVVSDV